MKGSEDALHRLFDGELGEAERVALEGSLTAEDHERLAALGELRALVRGGLEAEAAEIDLLPGIEAELKRARIRRWRERVRSRPAASVVVVAAALAALVLVVWPRAGLRTASNACDIETLEVEGAVAAVLTAGEGDDAPTIIWTEEN